MRANECGRVGGWQVLLITLPVLLTVSLLVAFGALLVTPPWENEPLPGLQRELASLTGTPLADAKLRQETIKIELENRAAGSRWSLLGSYAPFITAIVAGAAVLATLWKHLDDRSAQQDKDRDERALSSQRRFDERLTQIIANLGSQTSSLQASAAVSLSWFLNERYDRALHRQIHDVICGNLKVRYVQRQNRDAAAGRDVVNDLLVAVFERSLPMLLSDASPEERSRLLDLSCTPLARVDLSGALDLSDADLAFADLRDAQLSDVKLFRAKGYEASIESARFTRANLGEVRFKRAFGNEANFREANLTSARFEESELNGAQFQSARLQSAHFEKAHLRGASFEGANLNDAYFDRAEFDQATIRSIARGAKHWDRAHFDEPVLDEIQRLAGVRVSASK
jgi:uncharacterized protein YjbI with pentapeptide repeats